MRIKSFFKELLKFFGIQVRRIPSNFNLYEKNEDEILQVLIKNEGAIVLDVGANKGQSITRFQKILKKPVIFSFEPLPSQFDELKKFENEYIKTFNIALGKKIEKKKFYVNIKDDTSSFLKVNQNSSWLKSRAKAFNVNPDKFTSREIQVEINTVDNIIKQNNLKKVDLIKIDTQGFEAEVLEGAKENLIKKNIKNVEIELILGEMYEKRLSFYDIEKYLLPNGYRLISISNSASGNIIDNPDLSFRSIIYSCIYN